MKNVIFKFRGKNVFHLSLDDFNKKMPLGINSGDSIIIDFILYNVLYITNNLDTHNTIIELGCGIKLDK